MPPPTESMIDALKRLYPQAFPKIINTTGGPDTINTSGDGSTANFQRVFDENGTPWNYDPVNGTLTPMPSGYVGGLPGQQQFINLYKQITGKDMPFQAQMPWTPQYNWPTFNPNTGGSAAHYAFQYDPFSQQLQAAQLQESIRQANLAAGLDRSQLLNEVLANPANVFSSWFQSRGQVPPYNAQLANILNIPEGGNPWFGAMPPIGETPMAPTVPTPGPPQMISYGQGGTYIPAEPAVAIGLKSGMPLFTFNENAPAQTENVKITPNKVPSMAGGGTAFTPTPTPMYSFRGTGAGQTPLSGTNPWPLQDFYDRGGPQFPWLTNLGQGGMPGLPQLGNALNGFPVPSLQSLNQMAPSEQTALANWFNAIQGGPGAEDVFWAARQPFMNLRTGIPAMSRMA